MWFLNRLLLIFAALAGLYALIAAVMLAAPWSYVALVVCFLAKVTRRGYGLLSAYGSARWASADDLKKAGMLGAKEGLMVGELTELEKTSFLQSLFVLPLPCRSEFAVRHVLDALPWKRRQAGGRTVRLPNAVHTLVCAPTGAGKGAAFVIPHLLTCPDSCVVIDFKGDLASITAQHRREAFGHEVVILDPYRVVTQSPDSFNPLDFIDKNSPTAVDECRDLAEALVIRTGEEKEPHWCDAAELWAGTMLLGTVAYGE
jgi:type IV secretion system protein VirD4